MYTKCPECHVAFRITAKILQQAHGNVRCGSCNHAFNALAFLSEDMPTPGDQPVPEDFEKTNRRLLETLDELAGMSDVRIEDTGVEWRVLDSDEEQAGEGQQKELRYDDNTPLPEDFGDAAEEEYVPPAPRRHTEDQAQPGSEPDSRQADLALSDPEDWTDLLDEFRDPDPDLLEVEEELAAIHTQLSSRGPAGAREGGPGADDEEAPAATPDAEFGAPGEEVLADDVDFELTAEDESGAASDLDLVLTESESEVDVVLSDEESEPDVVLDAEDSEPDLVLAEAESAAEAEEIDDARALEAFDKVDEEPALETADEVDDVPVPEEPAESADLEVHAGEASPAEVNVEHELLLGDSETPAHESGPEDAPILTIQADGTEAPEPEKENPDLYVPPPSEEEMTINMEIDQELLAANLPEEEDDFAATLVGVERPEEIFERNPEEVETIIMEGEFIRTAVDQERLAGDRSATDAFAEGVDLADTYALSRKRAGGRRWNFEKPGLGTSLLALLLAVALGAQYVHYSRESLATMGFFNQTIAPVYRMLGMPVTPEWDIRGWQFEATNGSVNEDETALTIVTRIGNRSAQPLPYPLVHVSLTDRFEDVMGSRILEPGDYLAGEDDPSRLVQPGNNFTAIISIQEPSVEATGFKLNVCYRVTQGTVRCAIEDFKN